jgi:hypothetical protein
VTVAQKTAVLAVAFERSEKLLEALIRALEGIL